jgi:hypothetical protein
MRESPAVYEILIALEGESVLSAGVHAKKMPINFVWSFRAQVLK